MKYLYTKKLFLLLLVSLHASFLFAQSTSNFWKKTTTSRVIRDPLSRKTHPDTYQVYELDLTSFQAALTQAPLSDNYRNTSGQVMEFPMSDGTFQKFEVTESSIMEPKLAEKFPEIKTYKAIGVDDETATMRFSVTQNGLHAFSLSGKRSSEFIDPQTVTGDTYMVYNRSSLGIDTQDFECLTEDDINLESLKAEEGSEISNTNDSTLRTFRLALSCNAKYGALFAGEGTDQEKKANILAQMVVTINRVNEIYERDLAITLVFIDRNDELIYYDTDNDPWGIEFSTKTQQVISSTLGDESLYDIGHNFNTSNGGNSGCIGCVCVDAEAPYTGETSKGRGYTGSEDPTGDAFDIDYVAHEMGHQFGAWHTMNTCSRSGNGISEVEPASGSSIMGYSGICGVNNVQDNSDAHFNFVNIRDISKNIQPGGVSTCAQETDLENTPPVANAGQDYTIPVSTPFVLKGEGNDVDGISTLTYNWSQNDPERAPDEGAPQSTWTVGPLYRSILPTHSPNRYMPSLSDVVNGDITPKWEVTPSVARTMNFALTIRDNGSGFPLGIGQVDTDLMTVTVVDGTPFKVLSPNVSESWYVGVSRKITWEVGETNVAPISSSKVNIKLSLDGGLTYPVTLASKVDNDGSETIFVPDYESETCRILIEAADNIFYDISDANFSIKNSEPIFVLEQEDEVYAICNNDASLEIPFRYTTVSDFNELTTFSASNLPDGVTATFNPTSAQKDIDVILTLQNFDQASITSHDINIIGTSNALTETVIATVEIESAQIESPNLLSPINGATEISEFDTLTWAASDYALEYEVDISSTSDFSSDVSTYMVEGTSYNVTGLEALVTYYWRVRAINTCGISTNSEVFSFSTSLCTRCTSYGIDYIASLETSTTRVIFNSMDNVSGKTGYSDFTSIENNVKRGEVYPISVYVNTSGSYTTKTVVWIDWNNNCDFTDAGEMYELGEATNVTNGITGNSPLDITVPLDAVVGGKTIMRVSTKYRIDPESCETEFDGEVEDYKLTVLSTLGVAEETFNDFKIWPNPNTGTFTVSLTASSNNDVYFVLYDLRGRKIFAKSYESSYAFSQRISLNNVASGLYLLEVSNGEQKTVKKIVIE
ncbi:reprolysin-like metallopeptidase [uncultured Formosa sp.]|uniref:reprolysin-like metallopeptidase n=1 Tax=uncultured Formosa sp. TaxID=255435 RepID=UPI0026304AE0|nr:zinc-dependent metalloprotease family protein [uncultured Formosa sp.]